MLHSLVMEQCWFLSDFDGCTCLCSTFPLAEVVASLEAGNELIFQAEALKVVFLVAVVGLVFGTRVG